VRDRRPPPQALSQADQSLHSPTVHGTGQVVAAVIGGDEQMPAAFVAETQVPHHTQELPEETDPVVEKVPAHVLQVSLLAQGSVGAVQGSRVQVSVMMVGDTEMSHSPPLRAGAVMVRVVVTTPVPQETEHSVEDSEIPQGTGSQPSLVVTEANVGQPTVEVDEINARLQVRTKVFEPGVVEGKHWEQSEFGP
jgi:hypothetical protein